MAARCAIGVDMDELEKVITKHLEIFSQFHRHKKTA
jgi:hypothetical protein